MKNYTISTGDSPKYDGNAYVARLDWGERRKVTTLFTPDEGGEISADASVALFEKVYARKEYYLMLCFDLVKAKLVEEMSDEEYRECTRDLPAKRVFDGLTAEVEVDLVVFGNEGEIQFNLYDFSMDCRYTVEGTLERGFTDFSIES